MLTQNQLKSFVAFVTLFCISLQAEAQFEFSKTNEIEKIKGGTTYVVMKDPANEISKPYVDVFKKYWTFSEIKFIKPSEIRDHILPQSAFFMLSGFKRTTTLTNRHTLSGAPQKDMSMDATYMYMELITCKESFFKGKDKEFTDDDAVKVARIALYPDYKVVNDPHMAESFEYDGDGHLYNWGPGILKNYIQHLTAFLNSGKEEGVNDDVVNTEELHNLQAGTLLIPDYVLNTYKRATGEKVIKMDPKEIMGDYKFKSKLLPVQELSDKILEQKEPFYYLVYLQCADHKYITVINAETGAVVYSKHTGMSFRIKSDDLKDLSKKIAKS